MKQRGVLITILSLFLILPTFAQKAQNQAPGKITTIQKSFTNGIIDGYTIYIPRSYNKLKKDFALMIFLHGGLGVGGDVDKVNEQPLPELLLAVGRMSEEDIKAERNFLNRERNEHLKDSFIVVSPHLTEGAFDERQFYNQEDAIREMIKEVEDNYKVDGSRIYITGLSRGGHGTWGLAARMNDILAAAIPIAGGLHGVEDLSLLKNIPLWVAHNNGDDLVSYERAERAIYKLEYLTSKKFLALNSTQISHTSYLESKRIFTTFDRDAHDAWTDMYGHVEMYKWLLRQRRE